MTRSKITIKQVSVQFGFVIGLMLLTCANEARSEISLVEASRIDNLDVALALIKNNVNVNAAEANGTTALHWAVYSEDVELVTQLLKAGANVAVENDFGSTPMAEAAYTGNADIIKLLLNAGADPNSSNREGQTALMAVARTGKVDAATLLLKAGADVNAKESWGDQTALMWAASQSQPDMVKLLIKHGAELNARGKIRNWQRRVTAEPRPKDLDRGGFTPLLYAARGGCIACARHLVDAGADINLNDPDRVSPLVLALLNFHFDLAAYLIDAGADIDRWDLYGRTPLYAAVDAVILPAGGRPDIPSTDKITPVAMVEKLLKAGANPNIQLKLRPPYRNVIYDRGADAAVLTTGATPLLLAAKTGANSAIPLLIQHGALLDLPNQGGITPIMTAAGMGHNGNATRGRFKTPTDGVESIKLLATAGGNINAQNDAGQTALHAAAQKGWTEVVKVLLELGADASIADNGGRTPLDYANGNLPPRRRGPGGGGSASGQVYPDIVALLQKAH